jgi:protein TonB
VGGNVQQANIIEQVRPVYPPLAKQARIQGVVVLEAVIGKDGTIQNLRVITGHPLLIQAAQNAVGQWRYKPTMLNNEPVEVVTTITVNFAFSN